MELISTLEDLFPRDGPVQDPVITQTMGPLNFRLEGNKEEEGKQLLYGNVQRFQGGLVFKAHRLLCHSTQGLRVIKNKERGTLNFRLEGNNEEKEKTTSGGEQFIVVVVQGYLAHKNPPPP